MKGMLWSKLRLMQPFKKEGTVLEREEDVGSLKNSSNVNEEYKEAFRTKSYIDICQHVECQFQARTSLDHEELSSLSLSPSPSSSLSIQHVHLSEYLYEPDQETQRSIYETSNLNRSLINYLEISLEACKICESLLTNVHQVRSDYHAIRNVLKLVKRAPDSSKWNHSEYHSAYENLASFSSHGNPFSQTTRENFHELHDSHIILFHELTSQCRRTKRRTKSIKFIKRALKTFLVAGSGALALALLLLTIHGMVAAPGLVICSLFVIKKFKKAKRKYKKKWLDGLVSQLDTAARGVYILINDFDTISMLVQRLNDEMEHRRFVVDICVKKGKNDTLKEVVREFQLHEPCFLEQLEELENQIYLCFVDINRSRRLVVEEIVKF